MKTRQNEVEKPEPNYFVGVIVVTFIAITIIIMMGLRMNGYKAQRDRELFLKDSITKKLGECRRDKIKDSEPEDKGRTYFVEAIDPDKRLLRNIWY